MPGERFEVALAVRDEPDAQLVRTQHLERRERVLVEEEVLVPLPFAARRRSRTRARLGRRRPCPRTMSSVNADPELLVVHELGVALEVLDRAAPRLVVAVGVERSGRGARRRARSPPARARGPGRKSVKSTSRRTAFSTERGYGHAFGTSLRRLSQPVARAVAGRRGHASSKLGTARLRAGGDPWFPRHLGPLLPTRGVSAACYALLLVESPRQPVGPIRRVNASVPAAGPSVDSISMASRDEIVAYANALLEIERFPEFAPQGLQVIGADDVTTIACGVSSSRELFERAVGLGAQLVLVHHGLFWRNEPLVVDARLRGRLEALFRGNASLLAYHLALDAHPTLGNNAQLADRASARRPAGPFGGVGLGCTIEASRSQRSPSASSEVVGRSRSSSSGGPTRPIARDSRSRPARRGYDLIQAAHEGFDALLTGEPEEPSAATARELGIHLIAAGHHATERSASQALAAHLADRFGLAWHYIEVDNPV